MVKELIQLAAVLAITLFLASGCASTAVSVPKGPFDFTTLRKFEGAAEWVSAASRRVTVSDESRTEFDMAWAYSHAGQVAVAEGKFDEANDYFDKALDIMTEIIAYLKLLSMMETPEPRFSF